MSSVKYAPVLGSKSNQRQPPGKRRCTTEDVAIYSFALLSVVALLLLVKELGLHELWRSFFEEVCPYRLGIRGSMFHNSIVCDQNKSHMQS